MDTHEKDYPVSIMSEVEGKKAKRKTRRFSAEFKASAVALVLDEGRTIEAVVDDLGLTRSSFCTWLRQARIDRGKGKGGLTAQTNSNAPRTLFQRRGSDLVPTGDDRAGTAVRGMSNARRTEYWEAPTLGRTASRDVVKRGASFCIASKWLQPSSWPQRSPVVHPKTKRNPQ